MQPDAAREGGSAGRQVALQRCRTHPHGRRNSPDRCRLARAHRRYSHGEARSKRQQCRPFRERRPGGQYRRNGNPPDGCCSSPRGRREAVERQATGDALFDKIEFDRSRSMRCPIRISVRRGEYPPRFRSTRCMMFARCRARRARTSLYPIASYGEISVCIPLSLLQMRRVCYSERVQITFGGKTGPARMSLNLLRAQIARCFATECAESRSRVGLEL